MAKVRNFSKYDTLEKFKSADLVEMSFLNEKLNKKTGCRNTEILGKYLGSPLSLGNVKVHRNTGIYSIFPGCTCLNCKDCIHDCYACRELRYPTVFDKRLAYTYLAVSEIDKLARLLDADISYKKNHGMKFLRIHESGDFFSQDYIDMWVDVTSRHKNEIRSYYFTKVNTLFDFSKLKKNNVHECKSILPDGSINFGDINYCLEKAQKFNIPICPYQKDKKNGCGKCTLCATHEYVMQPIH